MIHLAVLILAFLVCYQVAAIAELRRRIEAAEEATAKSINLINAIREAGEKE